MNYEKVSASVFQYYLLCCFLYSLLGFLWMLTEPSHSIMCLLPSYFLFIVLASFQVNS